MPRPPHATVSFLIAEPPSDLVARHLPAFRDIAAADGSPVDLDPVEYAVHTYFSPRLTNINCELLRFSFHSYSGLRPRDLAMLIAARCSTESLRPICRYTHRLAEVLKIGKHELEITLDRSSSAVTLLEPSSFRNQVRNIPWVWLIAAGLILLYYLSR